MTIKISFGVWGEHSSFISFIGVSSVGQYPASRIIPVDRIDASVNSNNSLGVDVFELPVGVSTQYELYDVDYREFVDDDDNTFASAQDVADYITTEVDTAVSNILLRFTGTNLEATPFIIVGVSTGQSFQHKLTDSGVISVFWDRDTFPSGVSVSPYDRRIVTGTISSVGDYYLSYEKVNAVGIVSATLHIQAS